MTNNGSLHRINIEEEKYYLYSTYSEDKHEFQIQLTDGIYSCQGKGTSLFFFLNRKHIFSYFSWDFQKFFSYTLECMNHN